MPRIARSEPGHWAPAPSPPQKIQARQQHPDDELERVLRHARKWPAHDEADRDDQHDCGGGRADGQAQPRLHAAEADDDERDLQALEQNAFERDGERVPVHASRRGGAEPASARPLANAAASSCRGLYPLARRTAFRSHCRPNDKSSAPTTSRSVEIGITPQSRPERGHDRKEHDQGRAHSHHRRAPAADDPDRQNDRQRFDCLDRARQEGREEEEMVEPMPRWSPTHTSPRHRVALGGTRRSRVEG